MSRVSRWKPEKTKIKVVFRLQFHATHIPQSGWDKLFITFIPADSGKATAKTTKANVRNGSCKWGDPIYETTRLLQDVKTRQFDEKLYKFVVSMGSSRASVLGEAAINLADYADALKPSSVALPLAGCDSGAVLHVTVQLLTSKTGFREFEQQRETRERGLHTQSDSNSRNESVGRVSSSDETVNDHLERSRFPAKSKSGEHLSFGEDLNLNEDQLESSVAFDGSSNTSESLYADKHETSSAHEADSITPEKAEPSSQRSQGTSDWIQRWGSDFSPENDLAVALEENTQLRGSLEVAEASVAEMKMEVGSLQSYADELGAEAQKFAQQLAAEMASGENLAREVAILKSECSKFKGDLEVLKDNRLMSVGNSADPLSQDLQLRWLKGLLLMEDKLREFQNKASFGFNERELRVLGSDFEAMLVLLQDLKQGTGQAVSKLNFEVGPNPNPVVESDQHILRLGFGSDLYQPQEMNLVELTNSMENRIDELMRELAESKVEKEGLTRKMDEMECYYEALVQELEGNQRHILGELQNLRNEHSACLYAVSSSNTEMERMRQDMNDKLLIFTEEKRELDVLNKELERRAVSAEAALKRARLNYSIAVGQLQKDLELLSSQVSSMYEANENLIKQAFEDPDEVTDRGLPENFQKPDFRSVTVKKQQTGGDVLLDDMRRSLYSQEELYRKVEDELQDMHLDNIQLDVLSKTMQEALLAAVGDIELTRKSNSLLMLKLQNAMNEIQTLNEDKISTLAKCNETILQNEILEAKLRKVTNEITSLTKKTSEMESLMAEYRSYESQYKLCAEEKIQLQNLLNEGTQECGELRMENVTLQEKLATVEAVKEDLQKLMNTVQEKLLKLLNNDGMPSLDLLDILSEVEELQHRATQNMSQLVRENEKLAEERDALQAALSTSEHHALQKISQLKEENIVLAKEREAAQASVAVSNSDKENLQNIVNELQEKLQGLCITHCEKLGHKDGVSMHLLENVAKVGLLFETAHSKISQLQGENEILVKERDAAQFSLTEAESVKEDLQKYGNDFQGRLRNLLSENVGGSSFLSDSAHEDVESMGLIESVSKLRECLATAQHKNSELEVEKEIVLKERDAAHSKISQLQGENEILVKERDAAQFSLTEAESVKEDLQKYGNDFQGRLRNLLSENVGGSSFLSDSAHEDVESMDLIERVSKLRECLATAQHKNSELEVEKEIVLKERDAAQVSLTECESVKEDLQKHVKDVEGRLHDLLCEYGDVASMSLDEIVSQLGEFQNTARQRLCQLEGENEDLVKERDAVQSSFSMLQSAKENLEITVDDLQQKLRVLLLMLYKENADGASSLDDVASMDLPVVVSKLGEFLQNTCQKISRLVEEKGSLVTERDVAHASLSGSESEVQLMKQRFEKDLCGLVDKAEMSNSLLQKLQEEVEVIAERLRTCLEAEEKYTAQDRDLLTDFEGFKEELDQLTLENSQLSQEIRSLGSVNEELGKSNFALAEYSKENHALVASVTRLESEIIELKGSLQFMERELETEKLDSCELEKKVSDLQSELDQTKSQLLNLDEQNDELVQLRQQLSSLELEKEKACHLSREESVSFITLEDELFKMHGHLIASEVQLIISRGQYQEWIENTGQKLCLSETAYSDLHEKHLEVENRLNRCLANEANYVEENEKLLVSLNSMRCDLEASVSENRVLCLSNTALMSELEEQRKANEVMQDEGKKYHSEIESLMHKLGSKEEEMDALLISNEELEIELLMLKEKLEEQFEETELLERKCDELSAKTEELTKLSSHLKELKEKAETELLHAREKKDAQESLRIAFIKEQCETKLLESKHQLSISKKHAEEMLLKLQDSLDELESRKRNEASNLKRNEELSMRILELEDELQELVSERRERTNAYDCMKAEMECSLISLECCKEEKQKLEDSLLECNEEKSKIAAELTVVKELLESSEKMLKENTGGFQTGESRIGDDDAYSNPAIQSSSERNLQSIEDLNLSRMGSGNLGLALVNGENSVEIDSEHASPITNDHFKVEELRLSMDNLNKELEKMKNENWQPHDDDDGGDDQFEPLSPNVQRELVQLDKANKELGSIFPSYSDFTGSGNALERVLALELELAESLKSKKKSSFQFQSSFLRQHGDEEAIFKSFKDINELIKDMIDLKGKYSSVENELKEMHGRYSQLSLQFAEVEGERQKLMMTLKCVRSSKKAAALNLSRSSSASLGDH